MQQLTDEQVDKLYQLRDFAFNLRTERPNLGANVAFAMVCELLLILAPRGLNGE